MDKTTTNKYKSTYTITFGDRAENHVGMQMIGNISHLVITYDNLKELNKKYGGEFHDISNYCQNDGELQGNNYDQKAAILVLRNYLSNADELLKEQNSLEYDSKVVMYGRVVNKHARYNICFGDKDQEPDYENKKGRIVSFDKLPYLRSLKNDLKKFTNIKLVAEGNYYYDSKTCFIGWHGDTERKIVIAIRLGASMNICYNWYKNGKPVGEQFEIVLNHGDLYIMSDKAVGNDWKKRSIYTLRHAVGEKFSVLIGVDSKGRTRFRPSSILVGYDYIIRSYQFYIVDSLTATGGPRLFRLKEITSGGYADGTYTTETVNPDLENKTTMYNATARWSTKNKCWQVRDGVGNINTYTLSVYDHNKSYRNESYL